MRLPSLTLLAALALPACAPFSSRHVHDAAYVPARLPAAPDYTLDAHWAALPTLADASDVAPEETAYPMATGDAAADVFFVYPTLYTDEPDGRYPWNASVTDADLNARVDESTVRMQASAFNAAGPIYAPRYRQAHISAYYTGDAAKASAAFDTAYADIRRAFEHFLTTRPDPTRGIVIAGHSQGTTHNKRLVRDYFDPGGPLLGGEGLSAKLVAAYLVGIPVAPDYFAELPPCAYSKQTGCFVSWRTWQRPATPYRDGPPAEPAVVVNPLSWTTDTLPVLAQANPGGTLRKLRLIPDLAGAQVYNGILWIERPNFFGKRFIRMDDWHAADINLFYESVRGNAVARSRAWEASRRRASGR